MGLAATMAFYVLHITCVFVASIAIEGGMNMVTKVAPYQVRFGKDGRLRMDDFVKKTACGHEEQATTGGQGEGSSLALTPAFHDASESPCATYQTSSNEARYPVDATTISFPVRLDFTLKTPVANLIELRFVRDWTVIVYVVQFRSDGLAVKSLSAPADVALDFEAGESQRFWVTYENGEVKVGLHGNVDPLLHYIDPNFITNEVNGIELYSETTTYTEWKFYAPCAS